MAESNVDVIWRPDPKKDGRNLKAYMRWLGENGYCQCADYESLWHWSVENIEDFWKSVWEYFDFRHSAPYTRVLSSHDMPGAHWFEGARLNFAEQVFRFRGKDFDGRPAIIARSELWSEDRVVTWGEFHRQVAAFAQGLRDLGVGKGDRVVAYLPNVPETMVAFAACAAVGAVWSVCSLDMGTRSVLDRFHQIEPKVLIATDGYRYGGKDYDRLGVVRELRAGLPSIHEVVFLPLLNPRAELPGSLAFGALASGDAPPRFEQVEFEHPLWIVYSSGTTGLPKPIVHGHGGILLELTKHHSLNLDLGPRDRFFWFSSTGWVMWNLQVAGLLVGATACIFDGNPGYPDAGVLWRFVGENDITFFGAGAAYFDGCRKAGVKPRAEADLSCLRGLGSTGSPLSPECAHWLMEHASSTVMIVTTSGGTDVGTGYVVGCPLKPVIAGEIPARGLGIAVQAFDDAGHPLQDAVGELVVTEPMPTMPLYFWGDSDGSRLRSSYFDIFPGVWRHGDWIRITPRGGAVIYGRSDTTINRHGVRMGTGEIYRVVEGFDEITDSLVVDLEYLGRESWMPLFVVLRAGSEMSDALKKRIKSAIRDNLSPRHVPNEIIVVAEIPRTLSGKKMELPVKKLLLGMQLEKVASADAMSNPRSLDYFIELAARRNKA